MNKKTNADLMKLDLYKILGVARDATDKEILKAYRKRALKCHPDKNPDNPKAAEEFHQLSQALEVLTDAAAKAAYDNILKARQAAELRKEQLDSKRKKLKQDLEERELAASHEKESEVLAERNLEAEIERLRKEGSKLLEEEQERMREELKKATISEDDSNDEEPTRLRLKWKVKKGDDSNGGYSESVLTTLFSKYGEISALLMSKKAGRAILEFQSIFCGAVAVEKETGLVKNPLTLCWLSGRPVDRVSEPDHKQGIAVPEPKFATEPAAPSAMPSFSFDTTTAKEPTIQSTVSSGRDFEDLVLMRLRQAEERKRLIEQMQNEDENT